MVTLTWTSMNIESYISNVYNSLIKLEQLILNVNDIIENRIENNIKLISRVVLVDLPDDSKPLSLEQFVEKQRDSTIERTKLLKSKNLEIERAVDDLIATLRSYELDKHVDEVQDSVANEVKKY
jgi:dynein heavy chain